MAKKQNNLLSLRGWTSGEIPRLVVMIAYLKWWWFRFHEYLFTKANANPKTRQNRLLGCFPEQLLKNQSSKIDILRYRLTVVCPHSQVDKRYGQIVSSAFPYTMSRGRGGRGCQRKMGEGFSGLNTKLDTDGQPYLTIPYTSQGFQMIISDRVRWITREKEHITVPHSNQSDLAGGSL